MAGQWAQARDGLYRFEQDVMRELEAGGEPDRLRRSGRRLWRNGFPPTCRAGCPPR